MSADLILVKLIETDDIALIVNGQIVMTAEPSIDDVSLVEDVAEQLAGALDCALQVIQRHVPNDDEWTWTQIRDEAVPAVAKAREAA